MTALASMLYNVSYRELISLNLDRGPLAKTTRFIWRNF